MKKLTKRFAKKETRKTLGLVLSVVIVGTLGLVAGDASQPQPTSSEIGIRALSPAGTEGGFAYHASGGATSGCNITFSSNNVQPGQSVNLTVTGSSIRYGTNGPNLSWACQNSGTWYSRSFSAPGPGTHTYYAHSGGCSSGANGCSAQLTVVGPDLETSNLLLESGSLVRGGGVAFQGAEQNTGNASTGGGYTNRFQYRWGGNNNPPTGPWSTLSEHARDALGAGNSRTHVSDTFTLDEWGYLQVRLWADSSNNVNEGNESNNDDGEAVFWVESSTNLPVGNHETSNCTTVASGWACDSDVPGQPIEVEIYNGAIGSGDFISSFTASLNDEDAVAVCGDPNHGFSVPTPNSLTNAQSHDIYVYGIDYADGQPELLSGSPKTIVCESVCSDGVDNADPEDLLADAADRGCEDSSGTYDPTDDDETNDICNDGIDNDKDGDTDYTEDFACGGNARGPTETAPDVSGLDIQADPALVPRDGTSRITWGSQNAYSCTVTGDNGDAWTGTSRGEPGEETSPLDRATTYTLTCDNSDGDTDSASVTVRMQLRVDEI